MLSTRHTLPLSKENNANRIHKQTARFIPNLYAKITLVTLSVLEVLDLLDCLGLLECLGLLVCLGLLECLGLLLLLSVLEVPQAHKVSEVG